MSEAEEEAYVDGWKPLPAVQGASDEQGFLFRVRWKTTPEAGEYDYFDLDKIQWTHPNSIGWDEDNAMPSHPASALPSPPVSAPPSLPTSPVPSDNEQEAHPRAPSPSRSPASPKPQAAPPGQNPESKKNHSVNAQDESLVYDDEDSDDSAYDDLPVLEVPPPRSKKVIEHAAQKDVQTDGDAAVAEVEKTRCITTNRRLRNPAWPGRRKESQHQRKLWRSSQMNLRRQTQKRSRTTNNQTRTRRQAKKRTKTCLQ